MTTPAPHRDALRILFILIKGALPVDPKERGGAVACFSGATRLRALDFWVRSPDYLAEELMNLFEKTREKRWLDAAQQIFDDDEPDLRRVEMLRFLFGAYEPLDDALGLLRCRDLVRMQGVKRSDGKVAREDFLLTPAALALGEKACAQVPTLRWYEQRAELVRDVAGDDGGDALKQRQKLQVEYLQAELGSFIPEITHRVRDRLERLRSPRGPS